jgi:hypothetical protein
VRKLTDVISAPSFQDVTEIADRAFGCEKSSEAHRAEKRMIVRRVITAISAYTGVAL